MTEDELVRLELPLSTARGAAVVVFRDVFHQTFLDGAGGGFPVSAAATVPHFLNLAAFAH